ncbi:DMT family transporter [Desulfovibrio mangrovi]|uniref:EamA family transporter n=1 Tax=Desulfovibrio mangrovi TaxID=2976983 RepID=UPI0022459614|nr:EamA family transporter [Desulfovibrio mangrovi]UZP67767.1 DMT family transporter [Desulfovibrio mangrovi]
MLWFVLALGTAFFSALEATVVKKWLGHLSRYEMLACFLGWSWPMFALYILIQGWQPLAPAYWHALLFMLPLNILGTFIQYEAIRSAPLSLTMPLLAFTPAFMIVTGLVFLGEMPSPVGLAGIACIVAGSWMLNVDSASPTALLEPFRAIFRVKGSRYALYASMIWAVGAVLSKRMAVSGDPVYAGAMFFAIHNVVLVGGLFLTGRASPQVLLRHPVAGAISGLVLVAHIACHYISITMVTAAYMISIKRLNGLFSVLMGRLFFNDENVYGRLAGAAMMAFGAGIIAFLG